MKTQTLLPLALAFISLDLAVAQSRGDTIDHIKIDKIARARLGSEVEAVDIAMITAKFSSRTATGPARFVASTKVTLASVVSPN